MKAILTINAYIIILMLHTQAFAQTNLGYSFNSNGTAATKLCPETKNAMTDGKVNELIDKVLAATNLKNRFIVLPCSNISNCQAIYYEGKPYILYNASFLEELKRMSFSEKDIVVSNKNWEALTVLTHEIGHHFNNHLNNPPQGVSSWQLELEADEFAGSVISRLGGSLKDAQSAYMNEPNTGSYTHPSRSERLAAIAKGWYNEQSRKSSDDPKKGGGNEFNSGKYSDDFNIDRSGNWFKAVAPPDSALFVIDGGKMHLQNDKANQMLRIDFLPDILTNNFNFESDFTCSVSFKKLTINSTGGGIMFYSSNKFENYFLVRENSDMEPYYTIYQRDATKGIWTIIKSATYFPYSKLNGSESKFLWRNKEFNDIVIQKRGEEIQFYINNERLVTIPTKEIVGGGKFGLYSDGGGYQLFDDFKLEFMKAPNPFAPKRLLLNPSDEL
jgi:hypothetical protein